MLCMVVTRICTKGYAAVQAHRNLARLASPCIMICWSGGVLYPRQCGSAGVRVPGNTGGHQQHGATGAGEQRQAQAR